MRKQRKKRRLVLAVLVKNDGESLASSVTETARRSVPHSRARKRETSPGPSKVGSRPRAQTSNDQRGRGRRVHVFALFLFANCATRDRTHCPGTGANQSGAPIDSPFRSPAAPNSFSVPPIFTSILREPHPRNPRSKHRHRCESRESRKENRGEEAASAEITPGCPQQRTLAQEWRRRGGKAGILSVDRKIREYALATTQELVVPRDAESCVGAMDHGSVSSIGRRIGGRGWGGGSSGYATELKRFRWLMGRRRYFLPCSLGGNDERRKQEQG